MPFLLSTGSNTLYMYISNIWVSIMSKRYRIETKNKEYAFYNSVLWKFSNKQFKLRDLQIQVLCKV